jgi:hypothetical protein
MYNIIPVKKTLPALSASPVMYNTAEATSRIVETQWSLMCLRSSFMFQIVKE